MLGRKDTPNVDAYYWTVDYVRAKYRKLFGWFIVLTSIQLVIIPSMRIDFFEAFTLQNAPGVNE